MRGASLSLPISLAVATPMMAGGVILWAVILLLSIVGLIKQFVDRRFLLFATLIAIVILLQNLFYRVDHHLIYWSVTNPEYRENISLGFYRAIGAINYFYLCKFLLFAYVFWYLSKSSTKLSMQVFTTALGTVVFSQLMLVLFVYLDYVDLLLNLLGVASNAGNFLVTDQFGVRLSGFFHEPSQMSLVAGSLLGLWLFGKRFKFRKLLISTIMLIFFVVTSRSLAIFITLFCFFLFLCASKSLLIFLFISLIATNFIFRDWINLIVEIYPKYDFFFRSFHERLFLAPEIFDDLRLLFVGLDFGQVYGFSPIFGVSCAVGLNWDDIFSYTF